MKAAAYFAGLLGLALLTWLVIHADVPAMLRTWHLASPVLLWLVPYRMLFFALYAIWTPHVAHAPSDHLQILLLAVAMGLQAVIGQTINLTTIVFTTTLTKLVGTIADSIANGDVSGLKDVKIQSAVVVAYLFGALLAGALIVRKAEEVVLLPFIGVALAFVMHRRSRARAA